VTLAVSREIIQATMPLCSTISRKSTWPGSPVSLSTRLSIRKERLKPIVTGSKVLPLGASDAAEGFCLAT